MKKILIGLVTIITFLNYQNIFAYDVYSLIEKKYHYQRSSSYLIPLEGLDPISIEEWIKLDEIPSVIEYDLFNCDYRIISKFGGSGIDPGNVLLGTKLSIPSNTEITAPFDAVVLYNSYESNSYGYYTVIYSRKHKLSVVLGHLSSVDFEQGEQVMAGQVIALSGNSGAVREPTLFINVIKYGKYINPEIVFDLK